MEHNDEQDEFLRQLQRNDRLIYKVCMAYTDRQPDNVRDLYQDIVCNLWEGRRQWHGQCSESTWHYRVALNTAISQWRRRRRHPTIVELTPEMAERLAEEQGDTLVAELYRRIDRLGNADKAVTLLYLDGLSQAEMADILGINEAAVGMRVMRVKRRLQTLNTEDL